MTQTKKNRRRRQRGRGRLGPLLRFVSVLLTAVVIVVALTLFFKVERIQVSGNERYTAEEIIAVCGVKQGDNLILLDKYRIARDLYTCLPYITDVRINRSFPDGLRVEVTETEAALALESGGTWWLLSEAGKIVDITDASAAQNYLVLKGMVLRDGAVGSSMTLSEDGTIGENRVLELIAALRERGLLEKTAGIDASDPDKLVIAYDGRFDVEIGYDADFDFKTNCLKAVVDELEPNETGIIRMTMEDDNEVRLIPYKK